VEEDVCDERQCGSLGVYRGDERTDRDAVTLG
jgi:hypothetical protein